MLVDKCKGVGVGFDEKRFIGTQNFSPQRLTKGKVGMPA